MVHTCKGLKMDDLSIYFSGKKIVSMQRNQELILFDTNTNENSGGLINFSQTYYDLGIVKLINK